MSAACAILPFVWATALLPEVIDSRGVASVRMLPIAAAARSIPTDPTRPEPAFYRKYTEAMLRRYVKLSMEAGRAPSLLGREMFRGKVTSYRVHSFEDVVIYVHDVEKCLEKLDQRKQYLIRRIALQEYTQAETAQMMHVPVRTIMRRYDEALDRLTEMFLAAKLLEPMKECQGGGSRNYAVTA